MNRLFDPFDLEAPPEASGCFHCGEPVPAGKSFTAEINGQPQAMCCPGCKAVAEMIAGSGLSSFYERRTALNITPVSNNGSEAINELYDDPEVNTDFVANIEQRTDLRRAQLLIGNISCAACTWLIEQLMLQQPGVTSSNLHLARQRLVLEYDLTKTRLSALVTVIESMGYKVQPYRTQARQEQVLHEQREAMRRIGVAGIGMMQVGMIAIAMYVGDSSGMANDYRYLLRWVSALFATAVVFYAARGFFISAWRHLRRGALVMDTPVSLAIGLAYVASLWATITDSGEVYFDSVTMFTFFLLVGRFLERRAREQLVQGGNTVSDALPLLCQRRTPQGWQSISRQQLKRGDVVLVRSGETIPVDGDVVDGCGSVNQSTLDGEQIPRSVAIGDAVYAGTLNLEDNLQIRITSEPLATRLQALQSCIDRAVAMKPRLVQVADRVASHFIAAVLLITAGTAWYYLTNAPEQALWICLSVLVVSCPCALALATPTALTAASNKLLKRGVMVTGESALETLASITHMIFDKTGTLTEGNIELKLVRQIGSEDQDTLLRLAAGMQAHANHPLARAFSHSNPFDFDHVEVVTGSGIRAWVENIEYRIGKISFCAEIVPSLPPAPADHAYWVALCRHDEPLAWLGLTDSLRSETASVIAGLQERGIDIGLLTGDPSGEGERLASILNLNNCQIACSPEDKLKFVSELQQGQATVAMVGDGLNDIPVLEAAAVSVAVPGAADLAKARADIVLGSSSLEGLLQAVDTARAAKRIIRQNIIWALTYNSLALPLAIAGWVPPWAAAIGMSLSSLVVIGNSLRTGSQTMLNHGTKQLSESLISHG